MPGGTVLRQMRLTLLVPHPPVPVLPAQNPDSKSPDAVSSRSLRVAYERA